MNNSYPLKSFLLLCLLLCGFAAAAQTPMHFKANASTSSNAIPWSQSAYKIQLLYQPGDFNTLPAAGGSISTLYFRNNTAGATATYTNLQISYLQNSVAAFPNTTFYTGLTNALTAPTMTLTGNTTANGWFAVPLTTPIPYDNTKTLILEIRYTAMSGSLNTNMSTSTGNKRLGSTSVSATTGTLGATHNDLGIDLLYPCTTPPVAGTAVFSPAAPTCIGSSVTLDLTGHTPSLNQTYRWQSATSAAFTSPTNLGTASAASDYAVTASPANLWYRAAVTCGTSTSYSAPVQLLTTPPLSGTYTINAGAPASATNFTTFGSAVNAMVCGIGGPVVLNVAPGSGPYNEQVILPEIAGSSAVNTITFNGNGAILTSGAATSAERATFKINGADYVRLDSLTVVATANTTAGFGYGIQLLNDADNITINRCQVFVDTVTTSSTNYAAVVVSGSATSPTATGSNCDSLRIFNSLFNGGAYSLAVFGSSAQPLTGIVVEGNRFENFYTYGPYFSYVNGLELNNNIIRRPNRSNSSTFNGIYLSTGVNGRVSRNRITDPFRLATNGNTAYGIFSITSASAASPLILSNNVIYNFRGTGAHYGVYTYGNYQRYYHNTISLDDAAMATCGCDTRGFFFASTPSNYELRNNVVSLTRGGTMSKYANYFATNNAALAASNNVYYVNGANSPNYMGFYNGLEYASLPAWQSATGSEANSYFTNPGLTNPAAGDLAPTAAIDNLGAAVGISDDLTGATRNAMTPDMGALEFTAPACAGAPTAGTVTAASNFICAGSPIQLNIVGNSVGAGQTYQWQRGALSAGPFTNIGTASAFTNFAATQTTASWYRVAVTCGANTAYSAPLFIEQSSGTALAGTYTINPALPAGGTNFQSFTAAARAVACGISAPVVFNVASGSGPYNEQVILEHINGTSLTNTVTFNCNGVTLGYASSNPSEMATLKLRDADRVIFNDLNITVGGTTYGVGIQLTNDADSNTFNNCTVSIPTNLTSSSLAPFAMSGAGASITATGSDCDANTVTNCTFTGGYYGAVMMGSTSSPYSQGNRFQNNVVKDFYSYGIHCYYQNGLLLQGNDISRPTRTSLTTFYGILAAIVQNSEISGNAIHDPFQAAPTNNSAFYGLNLSSASGTAAQPNRFVNNKIYNVRSAGAVQAIYSSSSTNWNYYHNTVSLDDAASTATGLTQVYFHSSTSTGTRFFNNLFTLNRGGTGAKHIYYYNSSSAAFAGDGNVYHLGATAGTNNFGYWNGSTTAAALSNWQTATTSDANSVVGDPAYASLATGDLTPTATAAGNIGTALGISTDFGGNPRSAAAPDPGAIEWFGNPCSNPVAGTAVFTPGGNICIGSPVVLNLSGYTGGAGQTYQWQTATSSAFTTPTVLGSPSLFADTTIAAAPTSLWYRAALTCGTTTVYSTPVQVVVTPGFAAGTYTINAGAPASATNFVSFNSAVAAMAAATCGIDGPVVFNVVPGSGPYNEQVIIPQINGVNAAKTVTFNGNGNVLTFGSTNTNERATLKLNGADYITFDSLTVVASSNTTANYGFGIQLINDADNNTIRRCRIYVDTVTSSTNYAGLVVSGSASNATTAGSLCDSNVITGNLVNGGYYSFTLLGTSSAVPASNTLVSDNRFENFYTYGPYFTNVAGLRFEGNAIRRSNRSSVSTFYGLAVQSSVTGSSFTGNRITDPFASATSTSTAYGIYSITSATAAAPVVYANNLVYNFRGTGTHYAVYAYGNYQRYYHNTLSMDDPATTTCACETRAFYFASSVNNFDLRNNIYSVTRGGTTPNYAYYFVTANPVFTASNNVFNIASPGNANYIGFRNGMDFGTLPAWQSVTNTEQASHGLNPQLANPVAGNLTPTANIDNLGMPVGVGTDINGAPRSASTPDIGAYEFVAPGCTSPPTPGTATVANAYACPGSTIYLNLTGNSSGANQTYQWQRSGSLAGPYSNVGPVLTLPAFTATQTGSTYYRVAVTCGGSTAHSTPVFVQQGGGSLAGNYTINSAQPTGGTNYQSFSEAARALSCGITAPVVFNVAAGSGPYNEQVIIGHVDGTSLTNTVTFNGNGATLTYNATDANERATLKLRDADRILIHDLKVNVTGTTYGIGIHLTNDADSNVINGCTVSIPVTVTSSNFSAFAMSGAGNSATASASDCDGNLISNNTFTGGYYTVTMVGSISPSYSNGNRFINNDIRDAYAYSMYVLYQNGLEIRGNDVSKPTRTTHTTWYGVYTSSCTSPEITENSVHDPFQATPTSTSSSYGIYLASASGTATAPTKVYNNRIYSMNSAGPIQAIYNSSSTYCNFYHNTISLDDAASTATGLTQAYYHTSTSTGTRFYNNIISLTRGGSGTKHLIYFNSSSSAFAGNKNVYHLNAPAGTNNFGYWNGSTTLAALSNWQSTTAADANSVAINPAYTNLAAGNLTPTAAAAGGIGDPLGLATDINGSLRSATAPDPGAIEWPYAPCNALTGLAVNSITATTAALTWTAVAGAAGYQYVIDLVPTNPLGAGTPVTAASYNASGLTPNTTYYAHVRVNCGGNFSTWVTVSFTTLCPTAPTGLAVTGLTTSTAGISWNAVPGATGYQYALGTTATPPASGTAISATTYSASGLAYNTTYYMHVRTQCAANNFSAWSTISFTTACPVVQNVTVTNITASGADIGWNPVAGTAGYEWIITTSATPPAAGTFTTATALTASGLNQLTNYYLHVRVRCSTTNLSPWTSVPFMTACSGITATATPMGATTICEGTSVTLSANVVPGYSYQWKFNGGDIPGATSSTYAAAAAGTYSVQTSTSPICNITSAGVPVAVVANPVAIIQPSPGFICVGGSLTLATASPAPGYTYQWNLGGNPLPGAVASSLALATPGAYSLTVTNAGLCSLTSQVRNITLSDPQLTALVPGSVCGFGPVTLSATPTPGASVRWFAGPTAAFPLATGNSFVTPPLGATTAYYVSATEGFAIAGPASPASLNTALTTTAAAAAYTSFNVTSALNLLSVDVFPAAGVPIGTPASIEIRDAASALIATVPYTTTVTGGARQTVAMNVSLLPGSGYRIKQGTAIALTAASGGATYPYTAANLSITGQSVTASPSQYLGFYNWQLASGCEGPRQLIQAVVDPGPGAVISPAGPVAVCEGSSVSLQATSGGGSGLSYQWYLDGAQLPGATAAAYVASTAGAYQVRVGTAGGCQTLSDTVRVSVRALPVPVVSVSGGGTYLSTGVYDAYQWYRNGVALSGAVGQHHPAANDGQYTVRVRDNGGCYGTSAAVTVSALSVGGAAQSVDGGVQVYPNPARGEVWVSMVGGGALEARLSAMDGRVLVRGRSKAGAGALRLEMGSLAAGAYMVNVYDGEGKLLRIVQITKVE